MLMGLLLKNMYGEDFNFNLISKVMNILLWGTRSRFFVFVDVLIELTKT